MAGLNEKLDNVVNLQEDEKLKLQLEIRKMSSDLKKEVTASAKKKTTIENLDSQFNSLLKKGSVLRSELDTIKKDVVNQYTEAKISNPTGQDSVEQNNAEIKTVEDDTNKIIEKTNKHGILETKADAQWAIESIEKEIDASMATIDIKAEAKYDQWYPQTPMTREQQNIAFSGFAYDVVDEVNKQLLTVEERARITYRFELRNLKAAILQTQNWGSEKTGGNGSNIDQKNKKSDIKPEQWDYNRLRDGSENREIPDNTSLFVDFYKNINYAKNDINPKKKIFDVYKDKEINKALDTILDPNDKLRDGTFGINPSKTDGLAWVVDSLSGLNFNGYEFSIDKNTNILSLQKTPQGEFSGPLTWKQLKAMKLPYAPHKGQTGIQLDNEWNKLAKIFNTVSWDKLQWFSSIVNARTQSFSSINETANTVLTQGRLTTENVFQFLCDRNGDGILSADANHKTEQKNQGDIWNIFGQQLFFTIEQAIGVQEALHTGQGEQIVIQKILLNAGSLPWNISRWLMNKINEYSSDPLKCSRANLVTLIQDYPEFKTLFGSAIERMNGGNKVLTPDLYDTLTGNGIRDFLESKDWEFINKIEKQIDDALKEKKAKNSEFARKIANYDIIQLRQNLITQIMNVADGLTIVWSDSQEGYLRNPGASKEFMNKEAKNAFINDLTKETLNAIALGTFFPENGIRIPVTFIKKGKSESGRTLWRVQAGPSIGWNRESNDILLTLGVAWEIAEQYNYNRVINAPLDKVALAAKYIGAEWQIMAWAQLKELNLGIEWSAWISWEKSPIIGINQINRQYEDISKRIFRLTANDIDSYDSIYQALKSNINKLSQAGKYEKFATTNKKILESDVDFVVSFLKANDVLKNIPGNKLSAIEELMNIVQNGNLEQWRSDVLNNLHNKTMLTRLSFGVTTNMLTASFKNSDKSHTTPGTNTTWANSGVDMDSFSTDKKYKFGIAWYYVWARWSNFKTTYKINENQLANTRYEIAEGKNTYDTSRENFKEDAQYAKYIEAVFSKEGISVSPENGKIVIRNTNTIKLPRLLSIRVTPDAKKEVKYEEGSDTLTIWNVKEIGAYTTALANWVVRQLVIGSKKYKDWTESVSGTEDQNINNIAMKDWIEYQPVTIGDITKLANGITETNQKNVFLDCFGPDGQLKGRNDIPKNVSILNTWTEADNNRIIAWTIINFTRTKEGTYTLSLVKSEGSAVKLSFTDIQKSDFKTDLYEVKSPDKGIKEIFDTIDNNLKLVADLEYNNPKQFNIFMSTCDTDVRAASAALWYLLPSKGTGPLQKLRQHIQDIRITTGPKTGQGTDSEAYRTAKEKERYIVDQFKGLFAYETKYEKQTIGTIFNNRKEVFANLLIGKDDGKNHSKEYPDWVQKIVTIRQGIIDGKSNKWYSEFKRENVPELFGYTAFYRLHTNKNARDYKLVSTADTKVLPICEWENTKYRALSEQEWGNEAKNRILERFSQNKEQQALLSYTILANIKNETDRAEFAQKLTPDQIPLLLNNWKITLDNWTKSIILKTIPAFYFKGECANESLGLIIDSLEVEKASSSETTIQKEQIPDRNISIKAHNVGANPNPDQNQIWANLHVSQETIKKATDGSWTEMNTNKNGADWWVDVQ